MRRALKQGLADVAMTAQAGVFDGEVKQVFVGQTAVDNFGELRPRLVSKVRREPLHHIHMMHVMAGQAAHVATIMFAALPIEMASIRRVTRQASLIQLSSRNLRGINGSFRRFRARAVLRMFVTIAVAALANGRARIA